MSENKHEFPYPHKKQREFMHSSARFKALVWGRRSGKSLGIALYTMLMALERPGNYYIIAPTYKQAKSIYWQDILKVLIPDAIINKTDEGELYVEFERINYELATQEIIGRNISSDHTDIPVPSRIYLKGADNPDSLRGVSLSGAVLDEFAFFKNGSDVWRKIVRPALGDKQGWAIFSSTPDGVYNPFYEIVEIAKNEMGQGGPWFYSHSTALDNPYFPEQEWHETKKEYEAEGKMDEWIQEWEAKFTTPSTLVYNEFDPDIHVIHPSMIPREGTFVIGMDFGLKDPFAVVYVVIDPQDNWYVFDETYLPDLPVQRMATVLHQKMGDRYFTKIIGDSAGSNEIASLKDKSLGDQRVYVTPATKGKDSIRAGIRLVKGHLYVREGTGKPKLFVGANCKALIREFQSYRRLRDAWGEPSETPEDRNNHLMDALRYLFLERAASVKKVEAPPKVYDPNTGRLLS